MKAMEDSDYWADRHRYGERNTDRFVYDIDRLWPDDAELSDIFIGLTRRLQDFYTIKKGVLILNEPVATRFIATATWNNGKSRKNLSVKIPGTSSLFEKIAEFGRIYTDNFCHFFDGNAFERNLLLDGETQSFAVQPLKYEAEVVGLLGFSSDRPMAFATFEEGLLENIARQFARRICRQRFRA
ncbi:MAG: GAF domain-containing protein [candidate division Zixibacteria bacterium]|nr:GAF domain-containing protein [candidate division Zixibacteria bacterium]